MAETLLARQLSWTASNAVRKKYLVCNQACEPVGGDIGCEEAWEHTSVCVCVSHSVPKSINANPLKFFRLTMLSFTSAGGSGPLMSPLPTKLLMSSEDT